MAELPARMQSRLVPARTDRGAAVVASTPPLQQPGELRFATVAASREDLWERLSPAVRQRVDQRIGDRLEWWAAEYDGRIHAAVLGSRALAILEPTVSDAGRPATEIKMIPLTESSCRAARVSGPGHAERPPGPSSGPGGPATAPASGLAQRMGSAMAGFLGQLPPRSQRLMQDPFASGDGELLCDHYYRRHRRGQQDATLYVWGYLTDYRQITFCAGVGHGYRNGSGPSSWDVTCWRLDVAARSQQ